MSETNVPESIVRRLQKLLALANDSRGNENEAAAAAAKAQALMAEYNLSMASLGTNNQEPSSDRVKDPATIAAAQDWQVVLMSSIARNNFVRHWTVTVYDKRADGKGKVRHRRRHALLGRKINVQMVVQTYEYLLQAMDRVCPFEDRRNRSAISWFAGCADRLSERLDAKRREMEAQSRTDRMDARRGNGTDLVLSDVFSSEEDLNNDFYYGYEPGTTARRRKEREEQDRIRAEEFRREREEYIARHGAVVVVQEDVKPKTEKELEKERRAEERWRATYQRRQEREAAKIDHHAYHAGSFAGRDIGLDDQIEQTKARAKISG